MKYDTTKIQEAISRANQKAALLEQTPDEGSCNLDSAYLYVPGMRKKQAEEIGGRLSSSSLFGRIMFVGHSSGQAYRRTAMAEAVANSLKADGFEAGVWYYTD